MFLSEGFSNNSVNMKNIFEVMTIFGKSQLSFFKTVINDDIFLFEHNIRING
jgi:hypothetical protein